MLIVGGLGWAAYVCPGATASSTVPATAASVISNSANANATFVANTLTGGAVTSGVQAANQFATSSAVQSASRSVSDVVQATGAAASSASSNISLFGFSAASITGQPVALSATDIASYKQQAAALTATQAGTASVSISNLPATASSAVQQVYGALSAAGTYMLSLPQKIFAAFEKIGYMTQVVTLYDRTDGGTNTSIDTKKVYTLGNLQVGTFQGIQYDFGFAGAGDPNEPFCFVKRNGKYYYQPVYAQMIPPTIQIGGNSYPLNLYSSPLSVLMPWFLKTAVGDNIGDQAWQFLLKIGRLRPERVYTFKAFMLLRSALANTFQIVTAYDKAGNITGRNIQANPRPTDFPQLSDVSDEFVKLSARLFRTPNIEQCVIRNNGINYPSQWDPAKTWTIGDEIQSNPQAWLQKWIVGPFASYLNSIFFGVDAIAVQQWRDATAIKGPTNFMRTYGGVRATPGYVERLAAANTQLLQYNFKTTDVMFTDLLQLIAGCNRFGTERFSGVEFAVSDFQLQGTDPKSVALGTSVSPDVAQQSQLFIETVNQQSLQAFLTNRQAALATFVGQATAFFAQLDLNGVLTRRRNAEIKLQAALYPGQPFREFVTVAQQVSILTGLIQASLKSLNQAVANMDVQIAQIETLFAPYLQANDPVDKDNKRQAIVDYVRALDDQSSAEFPETSIGVQINGLEMFGYRLWQALNIITGPSFRGDEYYVYNDTYLGQQGSINQLLAILYRANSDLSKAQDLFKLDTTPRASFDENGNPITVVGQDYYNKYIGYENYLLMNESAWAQIQTQVSQGTLTATSPAYIEAQSNYNGAYALYRQAQNRLKSYLKYYEFDRRAGMVTGDGSTGTATDPITKKTFTTYSYERSVNAFLEHELVNLLVRSNRVQANQLSRIIYPITGLNIDGFLAQIDTNRTQALMKQQQGTLDLGAITPEAGTTSPVGGVDVAAQVIAQLNLKSDATVMDDSGLVQGIVSTPTTSTKVTSGQQSLEATLAASGDAWTQTTAPATSSASVTPSVATTASTSGAPTIAQLAAQNDADYPVKVNYNDTVSDTYKNFVLQHASLREQFANSGKTSDTSLFLSTIEGTLQLLMQAARPMSAEVRLRFVETIRSAASALKITVYSPATAVNDPVAYQTLLQFIDYCSTGPLIGNVADMAVTRSNVQSGLTLVS